MSLKRELSKGILIALFCNVTAQGITDSINKFSLNLLNATSAESDSPPNLALSPYTVWTLLTIIDEGAKEETARQLENVLGIPDEQDKWRFRNSFKNISNLLSIKDQDVHLDIYNSIFTTAEQKLKPDFLSISRKDYGVNVQPIDFRDLRKALVTINEYVSQATRNRINNFIQPADLEFAEIVILSALYFKGTWMMPFNRSETYRDTFYDDKENKLGDVDMMYHMGFFPYSRLEWLQGFSVELPYGKGDKMSMIVILPYKDQTLAGLLQQMTQYPFGRIIDALETAKEEYEGEDVKVYLPRFNIKTDLTLNRVLEKMGVVDVFDYSKANLLGMFPHLLHVSRLIQRAEIDVNEEGSVATAIAGATIANKIPPPKFVANKPFLYFIVNKPSKSIMFVGKVSSPP